MTISVFLSTETTEIKSEMFLSPVTLSRDPRLKSVDMAAIRRDKGRSSNIASKTVVCGEHFTEASYTSRLGAGFILVNEGEQSEKRRTHAKLI